MCKSDSEMLDVDALQARMESLHKSGKNMSIEWRLTQIKKFHHMLRDNKEEIREALMKDLGRQANEAIACDIPILEDEAKYFMRNLKAAMKPKAVSTPLLLIPGWCYVEKRPLNSPGVLIIGPYNYPFRLSLQPFLGALAGGNPAVIKPSDFTPHSGALIKKLVETYFEPEVAQVVLGGVPETTALLAKKWGLVFFTGSERVGRIVQKACADTLTPTVLELGGKCPTIVDETVKSSHIQNVADRIAFAKLLNAGQTCIAPDTVFVHESHARAFGQAMVRAIHQQYGEDLKNGELARIVNKSNTKRIIDMIGDAEKSGAKVLIGGSKLCDPEEKYICPTLIVDPPKDSKIMQEEIFGPIAPIVTFQTRAEAIQRIQELPGEPLQLYVFTPSTSVFEEYTANCRSAAAFRNDALVQGASIHLPFGGLGTSGFGKYVGEASIETFSHTFSVAHRPLGSVFDLGNIRCHPYKGPKGWMLENILLYLPAVPNLHTRKVLLFGGLCGVVAAYPEVADPAKAALIFGLEGLLSWLKN